MKYDNSKEIKYSISFEEVDAYLAKIDNKYEITYYHEDEVRAFEVETIWENDTDLNRPEIIELQLYTDSDLNNPLQTIKLNSKLSTYTFNKLAKYNDGKPIKYFVRIKELANYDTVYKDFDDSVKVYNLKKDNEATDSIRSLTIEILWDSKINNDNLDYIEIELFSDEDPINPLQVVKLKSNTRFYTFENLKKFKDGKSINYYVRLKSLEDYNSVYEEYDDKVIIKNIYDENKSSSDLTVDTGFSENKSLFILVISVSILALLVLKKQSIKRI